MFDQLFKQVREAAARDFTLLGLRMMITLWALFIIVLAWNTENKLALGAILAYEVLP